MERRILGLMDVVRHRASLPGSNGLAVPLVDLDSCDGCGRCADACPTDAVRLVPLGAGNRKPVIDAARCTYCTACEPACPTLAIDCPFEIVG